nr:reverse transcriptase [Ipomoea batatas]
MVATGSHDQLGVDVSGNNRAITIYDPKHRRMEGDGLGDLRRRVSDSVNAQLLRDFMEEEVTEAIFSMAPDKSLSPDGLTVTLMSLKDRKLGLNMVAACNVILLEFT